MKFLKIVLKYLRNLGIFLFFGLCVVGVFQRKPSFVETYSTHYGAFQVVDHYLEFDCGSDKVKKAAIQADREWQEYVYGPKPGVPCSQREPLIYRAVARCHSDGCMVSDITEPAWNALRESIKRTNAKQRPLI